MRNFKNSFFHRTLPVASCDNKNVCPNNHLFFNRIIWNKQWQNNNSFYWLTWILGFKKIGSFRLLCLLYLLTNFLLVLPTSTQLHLPPRSSLQHPQRYKNQNTARNWAISPNLGLKIQSCLFSVKIGTHGILEVLNPNLDLDFWNSDPKIHFCVTLGRKSQSYLFCLKSGTRDILRMLILIPALVFWISNLKSIFGQIWSKKVKVIRFV